MLVSTVKQHNGFFGGGGGRGGLVLVKQRHAIVADEMVLAEGGHNHSCGRKPLRTRR